MTARPKSPANQAKYSSRSFLLRVISQRRYRSPQARLILLLALSVAVVAICSLFLTSGRAQAPTNFQVTNTNDSGAGSLRDAISQANSNPTDDTIDFAISGCTTNTPCTITLTSGELPISNNGSLTITGPGKNVLSVSGNNLSRIFNIGSAATVGISNLTVTGGRTANGAAGVATGSTGQDGVDGAGIYNDGGSLTLTDCIVSGNTTGAGGNGALSGSGGSGIPGGTGGKGGNGGGIFNNAGALSLINTTVTANNGGSGGAGGGGGQNGGTGGKGGSGGGVYSLNGSLTSTNSTIAGNNGGNGGPGVSAGFNGGSGGTGGDGGGLYADGSSPTLTNSTFSNNRAGNGGPGAQGSSGNNGGFGGGGGSGGGIYNKGGTLTLSSSTVTANFSGPGANAGFGTFQSGAGGPGGSGAGVFCANTILNVDGGSIDSNQTGNGGNVTGNSRFGSNGGNGGGGSGIYFDGGTAALTNLTLRSNVTLNGGNGSNGAFGGAPGGTGGDGSGLYINAGTVTIGSTAIYSNATGNGGLGVLGGGGGAGGHGAGVYNRGTLTVVNSTISSNTGGNGNNGQTSQGFPSGGQGGSGAGIFNTGTLKTINVTVAGNASGTSANGGSSGAGGGILKSFTGTAHLRNTIVSGNNAQTNPDVSGQFVSDGHNFIGKNSSGTGLSDGVNGDKVGTVAAPKDPQLGPLQNNGGPTQTHNLPPTSLAAEGGDNCVLTANGCGDNNPAIATDQRGLARPQGAIVDIGAVEALPVTGAPDLKAGSDLGTSNTDNLTSAGNLQFDVTGAMAATTVELLRNNIVVASAVADGSGSVTIAYTDTAADGVYNFTARNSVSGFAGFSSSPLAVTIDRTAPTVTINQTGGQPDPTNTQPINFTAVFSEPVTSFTNANVSLAGSSANVSAATISVSGTGPTYNIAVSNFSGVGTVQASIPGAATTDLAGNNNAASTSTDNIVVYDNAPLTVTIEQAALQADPTSSLPINFTVVFNKPVLGFTNSDVVLTGSTANVSAATINVTGGGNTYNVAIGNVATSGTVVPAIPANAAMDTAGNLSMASTSTDHSVTYDLPPPTVTINQASQQTDPTNGQPINFTVVFSEPVTGFTSSDVSLAGSTANVSSANISVSGSGTTYNVAISNVTTSGVVQASIPAGGAVNTDGDGNTLSTSTDNMVTLDITPPSVALEQASTQADPAGTEPLNFTVVFSEPVTGFTGSDVSLSGSTAEVAGANINVMGSGANYNVAISNIRSSGVVQASIVANAAVDLVGNSSLASTSADNTVTFTTSVTNLVVNLTGDAGDGVCDATCTLRDAITTSNTTNGIKNVSFNLPGCQPASPCTISLASGELAVTNLGALNLAGPGANVLTVNGNNQSRVFNLALNSLVTISDLTITGGRAATNNNGGGILNGGVLSLTKVAINGSAAGDGSIGSFFSGAAGHIGGHGGGIYNDGGTVSLTNCTLSGNAAGGAGDGSNGNGPGSIGNGGPGGSGGGVFNNGGTVTVISSTFSGNTSGAGGLPGAQSNNLRIGYGGDGGSGGGIFNTNGTLTVVNSTFSGNKGGNGQLGLGFQGQRGGNGGNGGAIYYNVGTLLLINDTISGNNAGNAGPGDFGASAGSGGLGGGIFLAAGTARARNDIVAGNSGPGGAPDLSGVFSSLGHNFIGMSDGGAGFIDGTNGDQVGSIAAAKDAHLGSLQDNGGPTQTLNPAANSGAKDAGDNCVLDQTCSGFNLTFNLTSDQRGVSRPQAGGVDIGAVEILPAPGAPDLSDASDSGSSNTDNLTKESNLQFQVSGAQVGVTVQLRRNGTVVASAPADGSGNATLSYTDNSPDGIYNFTSEQLISGGVSSPGTALAVTIDRTAPGVTINQAAGQADPTSTQPIDFTVVFNEAVTGFTSSDVSLAGSTADVSAANISVTGTGSTYTVSVSNILLSGTVQASIPAGGVIDAAGNGSNVSTNSDNTVTLNVPPLTVTIDQAAGQADPINVLPVNFTVVFSSPVSGFSSSGISLAGSTANVANANITVTGSGTTYNVAISNITSGDLRASVLANAVTGIGGGNQASTSIDNTVTFDTNPPAVTINQANLQADPTQNQPINFTAVFNRAVTGFGSSGISLAGSTADVSAAVISITGSGTTYNVAVSNILSSGIVQASVQTSAASGVGGGNQASTSSDNTVTLLPTFVVNQADDLGDGTCDATCTLRDAIGAANNLPGAKIIGFDLPSCLAATPCTIQLQQGQFQSPNPLSITNNGPLTIKGLGAQALIIQGPSEPQNRFSTERIMTIATAASVRISDLTISGGQPTLGYTLLDGGGIYNDGGNLTLTSVNFSGNKAQDGFGGGFCSCNAPGDPGGKGGAIYNTGTLTLNNCTFSNNSGGRGGQGGGTSGNLFGAGAGGPGGDGGAVYNTGTLTVINSTFNGNNAGLGGLGGVSGVNTIRGSGGAGGNGGAIFNSGTLTFVNSTASGNNGGNGTNAGTHGNGGNGGNGGGILNNGTATVVNSTVANNNSGNRGVKGANGTTDGVSGNGGGIDAVSGSIYLRNTIVAKNTVGGTGPDLLGAFTSLGHNFIGKFDGSTGFADGTNFDWVGSVALEKDPMLGPLQNNGGPTLTLSLAGNSPAKDSADNCVLDRSCANNNLSFNLITDQRGVTRPQFAAVDIGAFEVAPALTVTINQANGQADPTSTQPINFEVVFSRAVTGFTSADVSLAGSTANVSAANVAVTGSGASYTVFVSNVSDGVVQASIPAGSAADDSGVGNDASTSSDNTVTLDSPPSVTINQAGTQADPTNSQPINFSVVFSEPVTGFTGADVSLAGSSADVTTALINVTGSGATYNVAVSNVTSSGTVQASIPANGAADPGGNGSLASTSVDNVVTLDITRPSVTINQANGQSDPTSSQPINFSVVFSEPVTGFTNTGVSLAGSTADISIATISVSGSGANYSVSVKHLLGAGIVQASIPANAAIDAVGNLNVASTTTDNTVTFTGTVTHLLVNLTDDAGDGVCDATCTLRDAITTANATPEIKLITFNLPSCTSGSPCTIALSAGELPVANNGPVNLSGPGANVVTLSGNNQSRIFNINQDAAMSMSGLTLTAGFSGNGANGGTANNGFGDGISGGAGQSGGGIYNNGFLTLTGCVVTGNATGNGGNGGNGGPDGNPRPGGVGGAGGSGGGIYNAANLTLNNSTIAGNHTGNGGNGGIGVSGSSSGRGGDGGSGAGVYNAGTLNLTNTTVNSNNTGAAGNGADANGITISGPGGDGGSGAGIYNSNILNITSSTISNSQTGNGGTGGVNSGHNNGGTGGKGGSGAGVYSSGSLILSNSTISNNTAGAGNFGGYAITFGSCPCGSDAAGGDGGSGAGIYSLGSLQLVNNTISNNVAGIPGGGVTNPFSGHGQPGNPGSGGGIAIASGAANVRNTIVFGNTTSGGFAPDAVGSLTSLGHNLIGTTNGLVGFGATGDLLNTNPLLGALQNNGGPTQTRSIDPNSPAKNAGDDCVLTQTCPSDNLGFNLVNDQRGITRPQFGTLDIGAFELEPFAAPSVGLPTVSPANTSEGVSTSFSVSGTFTDIVGAAQQPFTAVVHWGDGTTDAAIVSGSGNPFSYSFGGSHTYAQSGSYDVTVSVTDKDGSTGTSAAATVAVANVSPVVSTPTLAPTNTSEGASTPFNVSGTFTDAAVALDGPYTALITWGDGNSDTAVVTGSANPFSYAFNGSHAYAQSGSYSVTISVTDKDGGTGTSAATTVTVANAPPTVGTLLIAPASTSEGSSTAFNLSGTFSDSGGALDGPFTAEVNWGDGTANTTAVIGSGNSYSISANHTYAQSGSYNVTVLITDKDGGTGASPTAAVTVTNAVPTVATPAVGPTSTSEGSSTAFSVSGTFSDAAGVLDGPYTAIVNWGDGVTDPAIVSGSANPFSYAFGGNHTYAQSGIYNVTVSITDKDGGAGTSTAATITVTNLAPTVGAPVVAPTGGNEGSSTPFSVNGTFTDPAGALDGSYTAVINWGDGAVDTATVNGVGNPFTYAFGGNHVYAVSGSYDVTVSVTDKDGGAGTSSAVTVTVANTAPTVGTPSVAPASASEGSGTAFVISGTFTDPAGAQDEPYTAVVNWGDGNTDAAAVSGSGNPFSYAFSGNHTYAQSGSFNVTISVSDKDGSTGTSAATAVAVANVAPSVSTPAVAPTSTSEGTGTAFAVSGTFNDPAGALDGPYTAVVNWGDGSTDTAVVTGVANPFSYAFSGNHTYAQSGAYNVTVSVTDKDGSTGSSTATSVTVANVAPAVGTPALNVNNTSEGAATSFNVSGTFTDQASALDGPYTTVINWGDGASDTATVSGAANPFNYAFSGNHTYAQNGSYNISVAVTDKDGGTGTSAAITVAVANAAPVVGSPVLSPTSTSEGSATAFGLNGTFTDPAAALDGPFIAVVNWGDGHTDTAVVTGSANPFNYAFSGNHTYAQNGSYNVTVAVTDKDGDMGTSATITVSVANAAPVVATPTVTPTGANEGTATSFSVSGTFSDPTGLLDGPYTAVVNWDDGNTDTAVVTGSASPFSYAFSGNHTYAHSGLYNVTVSVTDKDGGTGTSAAAVVNVAFVTAYVAASGDCGSGNTPCFTSIQAAIDAVADGGTVNLSGGIFNEDVVLNRNVTVNVNGNTTINSLTISAGTLNGSNDGGFTLTVANGDWINNGGTFNPGAGTVSFTGTGQTIGGTNPTTFNGLTISAKGTILNGAVMSEQRNTAASAGQVNGSLAVAPDATVTGLLTLDGDLTVINPVKLIMTASATSAGTGDVVGELQRFGFVTGACANAPCVNTLSLGNPSNQLTFTGGTAPESILVNLAKAAPATFSAAVQRNYILTESGGSDFTATLRLHYLDSELNGNTEANLNLRRLTGIWKSVLPSVVDTANNWVESNAVTGFSQWTFASLAPTATTGIISGRILDDNGAPVAGAVVRLSGKQTRKTITDSNGNYGFSNVETTGFYTVTPSRVNYTFNPFNRSFSQLGNQTEAVFGASFTSDAQNPLDTPEYFVRQQYVDMLSREPDEAGFNFWTDRILVCGDDADCIRAQRIAVAAEFFIAQEFQQSGAYIYNLYQGALSRRPAFSEYARDRQQVVGGTTLEAEKQAFAQSFVERDEFVQKYQTTSTAEGFVDALLSNLRQSSGVDLGSQRDSLIAHYQTGTSQTQSRSLVLRDVTENASTRAANYNAAFVLTEYFGYLRRDTDRGGYQFWLNVLNETGRNGDPGNYNRMICSFLTATEYQQRFSAVISHGNGECGK